MIHTDKKVTSWKSHEKLADSYKAIGTSTIYLSDYDGITEFPWEYVTRCEPGGSHRIDISTDITFIAKAPSGLQFRWSFDIEPRSANGSDVYQIDTAGIKAIFPKVPEAARKSLKKYLADCAVAVRKRADEQNQWIQREYGMASELEALAG